jgi:hypothetical protein
VRREDVLPGLAWCGGDDLTEGGVLVDAPGDGQGGDGDRALEAGLPQTLEHLLHLTGGEREPAGGAGGEQQLLFLELEEEHLQQLALAPENG